MGYFLAGMLLVIITVAVGMAVYDYRLTGKKEKALGLRKEPRP